MPLMLLVYNTFFPSLVNVVFISGFNKPLIKLKPFILTTNNKLHSITTIKITVHTTVFLVSSHNKLLKLIIGLIVQYRLHDINRQHANFTFLHLCHFLFQPICFEEMFASLAFMLFGQTTMFLAEINLFVKAHLKERHAFAKTKVALLSSRGFTQSAKAFGSSKRLVDFMGLIWSLFWVRNIHS